ncbi:tRNA (adenosine(37)-N6)-threonylcarbamoyltransferase complex dimerization subunit type 1 TsaB [Rubrivirga sp.]|uniref:tRNA (adenosine(37)-N6)-threonylcarbamoyltransferase complex dimerization subunit type 1 TsaB n=1 Tax=Rubrivirga sp. TaxID=1885344 RepID=UPI003C7953B7
MLTLGIDTATDVCAVAVLDDDRLLARSSLFVSRSHGTRLAMLIREQFAHARKRPSDLEAVAVSSGPGSYTGLRIGMSTAKGLAVSTGCSFVAVPTLAALAHGCHGLVAVVLPSRRGEVYAAVYQDGLEVKPAAALEVDAVEEWLPSDLDAIGGPGAGRLGHVRPELARLSLVASGESVARLGRSALEDGGPQDPATAEPVYLKAVAVSRPRGIFAP